MATAAQPLSQQQEFDPVGELRKRYPGIQNEPDEKIVQHLSNPENFRSAFPEYAHLDDETITHNMGKYAPKTEAQRQGIEKPFPAAAAMVPQTKTPFEKNVTGEGFSLKGAGNAFWETLKKMVPSDPTGGRSLLDPKAWFNPDEARFDPANSGIAEAGREAKAGWERGGDVRAKIGEAVTSALASPLGVSGRRQAENAAHGEGGKIIGETAAPAAVAAIPLLTEAAKPLAKPIARVVRNTASSAADTVGTAMRTETNKLKPGVKAVSSLAKVVGGPELVDWLTPDRPGAFSAAERKAVPITQSPYYTENQARLTAEESARNAAAKEAAKADAQARKPVPVTESPYYQQNLEKAANARATEKAAAEADADARKPVPVTQSPYYIQNRIKAAAEAKAARAAETPAIVTPSEGGGPRFVGNEGRAATWTNERVMELARQGNREAIQQAVRRGMELPPNARYVAGDPAFSSGVYNPRDVTVFGPDGTPIRQGGKVRAGLTGRGGIVVPERKLLPPPSAKEARQQYIRPPEPPQGAGRGEPPAVMHPEELAEIRKETGRPNLSIVDAQRYRIAKLARAAAETKTSNDLGGMKRAGD